MQLQPISEKKRRFRLFKLMMGKQRRTSLPLEPNSREIGQEEGQGEIVPLLLILLNSPKHPHRAGEGSQEEGEGTEHSGGQLQEGVYNTGYHPGVVLSGLQLQPRTGDVVQDEGQGETTLVLHPDPDLDPLPDATDQTGERGQPEHQLQEQPEQHASSI